MRKEVRGHALAALLLTGWSAQSAAITDQDRIDAATATATSNAMCTAIPKFYWEIGDSTHRIGWGTRGLAPPKQTDQMQVYSATKWVYGSYVYQERGGNLTDDDKANLRMVAGYTETSQCLLNTTVQACHLAMDVQDPNAIGKYYYGAGHLQKSAAIDMNLGPLNKTQLATEIKTGLGMPGTWVFTFNQPQLGGGGRSSAADYALFLQKILAGQLLLSGSALGSNTVCTYTSPSDPLTGRQQCLDAQGQPASLYSPADDDAAGADEAWHYSYGHWVEDDPVWINGGGDAAYSSPGAAGFYPWIDANRQYYGILARFQIGATSAFDSVRCGRLIRKAWLSGVAQ